MFCLCMCALLKFIKVFCIVLYILMTLLVHCLSQSPAPPSQLRTGSPLDGPTQTLRSARTKIVSRRLSGKSGSRPFLLPVCAFCNSVAAHKKRKKAREKRIRCISPIRNRLQIKLWKFSGSAAFEVRRQKTAEQKLFLERYDFFLFPSSLLSVCFPFFFSL